jgi:hypothetical protein
MPNHVHGIIMIFENNPKPVGQRLAFDETIAQNTRIKRMHERIPVIIGSYKSGVTREINKNTTTEFQWQTSYHDHIIKNEQSLQKVSDYIKMNPQMWSEDLENGLYLKHLTKTQRAKNLKDFYKGICT